MAGLLRSRFDTLFEDTKDFLSKVIFRSGACPVSSLVSVTEAGSFGTKITRLIKMLETIDNRPIRYAVQRRTGGTPSRIRAKAIPTSWSTLERIRRVEAWGLLGFGMATFGVVSTLSIVAFGWVSGLLTAGLATIVVFGLLGTQSFWVRFLDVAVAHRQRSKARRRG